MPRRRLCSALRVGNNKKKLQDLGYPALVERVVETIKRNYKLPRESAILVHTLVETIKRNYKIALYASGI